MIKNYIKMALRSLLKNRLHSAFNIIGLSVGMCLSLFIIVFALGELQVNTGLKNVDYQYVIESKWSREGAGVSYTSLGPLAASLHENYPSLVRNYYRFSLATAIVSSAPDRTFKEELQIGDPSLLGMFGFEVLHGSKEKLFSANGIVITAAMAQKFFGRENAVGEVLTIRTNHGEALPLTVTAVLAKLPFSSITNFTANPTPNQLFLPMELVDKFSGDRVDALWDFKYMVSIVELAKGVAPENLQQPMAALIKAHAPLEISQTLRPTLAPLASYYLNWQEGKARNMLTTLSLIAFFVLFLATANFISMMITKSFGRLREIGVRRLLGEGRSQLMLQFLTESTLIALISLLLALGLYQLSHVHVAQLLGKEMPAVWAFSGHMIVLAIAMALLIGLLAGLYPSLRLVRIKLAVAIKGKVSSAGEGRLVRYSLIMFQLFIAIFVLIATLVISRQFDYLKDFPLGYDKEKVLVISSVPRAWNEEGVSRLAAVRHELAQVAGVGAATVSYEVPDGNAGNRYSFFALGQARELSIEMPLLKTDEFFAQTFGLEMLSGSYFHATEGKFQPNAIVLSETAARSFGWQPAEALGRQISWEGNEIPFTVIGVVRDFNFYALSKAVTPLAIIHLQNWNMYRYLSLKIKGNDLGGITRAVENKWARLYPDAPFEYVYMEDSLEQFYSTENRMLGAFRFANIFTIIITLAGIAAFMSFSLLKRRKGLGVRVVMGATRANLVLLYLREFLLLFVLACLGAFSLAYFFLEEWLQNFYYRVEISFLQFAAVGMIILVLVSLLIAAHVVWVSSSKLIQALKSE
jgi:putative ABC transport system permease protein